jgi:hypothetical protein
MVLGWRSLASHLLDRGIDLHSRGDFQMTAAATSIIQPKRPKGPGWQQMNGDHLPMKAMGFPFEVWMHREHGLYAITAVEVAIDPGEPELGPEYHLSVSAMGNRCSSAQAAWVLDQFDLTDAKEDNHVPSGNVRNYWRPVADNLSGYECPCQDQEPAMREDGGDYVWRGVTR